MKQKLVRVPFEVEMAKRIQNGEVEGRIITRNGYNVRIVCFDAKTNYYPIVAMMADENGEETVITRTIDGKIVPAGTDTDQGNIMLEIPEYLTYRDGDIIAFGDTYTFIGIFKNAWAYNESHSDYVVLSHENRLMFDGDAWTYKNARKATEEEKQKLIDALKASTEPKAKEYLKRFFGIEEKPKCEFKPFDRVLVRDYDDGVWKPDIFFNKSDGDNCMCTGNVVWAQCIHYNEQTAHLLGTTENWEDDIKEKCRQTIIDKTANKNVFKDLHHPNNFLRSNETT